MNHRGRPLSSVLALACVAACMVGGAASPEPSNPKKRQGKFLKRILEDAYNKGLVVKKNSLKEGWDIQLPNGTSFHAATDGEMANYVKGY